jgi:hypothetical protein
MLTIAICGILVLAFLLWVLVRDRRDERVVQYTQQENSSVLDTFHVLHWGILIHHAPVDCRPKPVIQPTTQTPTVEVRPRKPVVLEFELPPLVVEEEEEVIEEEIIEEVPGTYFDQFMVTGEQLIVVEDTGYNNDVVIVRDEPEIVFEVSEPVVYDEVIYEDSSADYTDDDQNKW